MTGLRKAMTLIELMLVVLIIGLLAGIAAAKYGSAVRKANEGALLGDLGALRSALRIYYSNSEGAYPSDLSALGSRTISRMPQALVPNYHPAASAVKAGAAADDSGGWLYNDTPGDERFGSVYVNCTHTDTKGSLCSAY